MALLTPQQISIAGLTPTFAAAAGGGDTVSPDDRTFLHVKTVGTGTTVTVVTPGTVSGLAITDATKVISTNSEAMIGPLSAALFADPTTGLVNVSYSATTAVTVAAIRI